MEEHDRRRPRLLASIPQCPLDPSSGAARSAREVCELLARNGWAVSFTATTAIESGGGLDAETLERQYGVEAVAVETAGGGRSRSRLSFSHRGVDYRLLDASGLGIDEARVALAADFDALVTLAAHPAVPDVLLTYGSSEQEVRRRSRLRAAGAKAVFFLRNFSYFHERSFAEVDAVLTPSRYLNDHYRGRLGTAAPLIALPHVLSLDDVVAPCREPVFCTLINPAPGKGLELFLAIAGRAASHRPELPFLIVESRGTGGLVAGECARLGFALESVNLCIARNMPQPHPAYAVTRVLLAPSTEPDAGPRVIPEAQLNGIPVIASNRCGFAQPHPAEDEVGFAGFVLPAAAEDTNVTAWFELICRLYDDESFYQVASRRAHRAAEQYRNGAAALRYLEFFEQLAEERPHGITTS